MASRTNARRATRPPPEWVGGGRLKNVETGGDGRQLFSQGVLAVLCWYVRIWCGCALRPQVLWGWCAGGEGGVRGVPLGRSNVFALPASVSSSRLRGIQYFKIVLTTSSVNPRSSSRTR